MTLIIAIVFIGQIPFSYARLQLVFPPTAFSNFILICFQLKIYINIELSSTLKRAAYSMVYSKVSI